MTEHSMCQPGRPGPHGDGQDGSPDLEAFHRAKSDADRRPVLLDKDPLSFNQLDGAKQIFLDKPSASSKSSRLPLLHGSILA